MNLIREITFVNRMIDGFTFYSFSDIPLPCLTHDNILTFKANILALEFDKMQLNEI